MDHPDNPIRIKTVDGQIAASGNFEFHNAIDQNRVMVFCLSLRLGSDLFEEFQADSCVESWMFLGS